MKELNQRLEEVTMIKASETYNGLFDGQGLVESENEHCSMNHQSLMTRNPMMK